MLAWRELTLIRTIKIKVIRLRDLYFNFSHFNLVDRTSGLSEELFNLLLAFRISVASGIPSRQLKYLALLDAKE